MSRANIFVVTTAIAATVVCVNRRELKGQLRSWISQILDLTRAEPCIEHGKVIETFRKLSISQPEGKSTNPHKKSAALRTSAVGFMRSLNLLLGTKEFSVSMSSRDQRDSVDGSRLYYWAKDADKKPMNGNSKGCSLSYVDVDYHVDTLDYDLAGRNTHSTIFTIIPRTAAGSAETSHTFDDDGKIVVDMAGGGHYAHHLWDWTPDTMTCTRSFLGFPYVTTIYKVEKKSIDDLKAMVLLAPIGTWRGPMAYLASKLQSETLKRFDCIDSGFAHIRHVSENGIKHSIAKTGLYTPASLTSAQFDAMSHSVRNGKQDPTTSSLATWCEQNRIDANIMASFFRATLGKKAPFVTKIDEAVITVSANVACHGDSPERVSVQAFMQPIVAGNCHAHTDHEDNSIWAAHARVTSLAQSKTQTLNPFVASCICEFVDLGFPETLCQSDLELVYEKQNRPLQRAIIAEAVDMGPSEKTSLKAFLKKEAYAGAKDPRIITTYRPGVKIGYSVYMYALTLQMKQHAWYGFKTPEQVAARVAEVCLDCDYAIEGDFSRMDGRVDANVRNVFEKAILNKSFPGDEEVHRLHALQYGQTVSLGSGSYQQGYARGSGSPETSVFNTALTAFVCYLALRMCGLEQIPAFKQIGIVAGDDSLQGGITDVPVEKLGRCMERAAKQMGQKITSDCKVIGEPVQFLSRYFAGAWYGDLNSMTCPLRLLSKVHCAVNIGVVKPEDKCRTKGESILAGDGNTPIIGALAKKMTTVGKVIEGEQVRSFISWWDRFSDCSWPNEYADWMEDVILKEMPDFNYEIFQDWIENGHALEAPTCLEVIPSVHIRDLMVGDELSSSSSLSGRSSTHSEITKVSSRKNPRIRKTKRKSKST